MDTKEITEISRLLEKFLEESFVTHNSSERMMSSKWKWIISADEAEAITTVLELVEDCGADISGGTINTNGESK